MTIGHREGSDKGVHRNDGVDEQVKMGLLRRLWEANSHDVMYVYAWECPSPKAVTPVELAISS